MNIEFEDATGNCPFAEDRVINWANTALTFETNDAVELAIRVVNARESQKLNKTFTAETIRPMFSVSSRHSAPEGPKILGDIAIASPW